ncbi:hypothetical protein Abr02nite_56540 [Paractinoplanes brasiliensis]|nr:hypothetical protein Abr02nite_56540 [Actinoplanes brasiliensis]
MGNGRRGSGRWAGFLVACLAGMVNEALAQELIGMTDKDRRLQPGALGDDSAAQPAHRRVTVRNGHRLPEILRNTAGPLRNSSARKRLGGRGWGAARGHDKDQWPSPNRDGERPEPGHRGAGEGEGQADGEGGGPVRLECGRARRGRQG